MNPGRVEAAGWAFAAMPALLLAWGLAGGAYDASPWRFAVRESGLWAMRFTTLALAVSPFVAATGFRAVEPARRAFGLAGALYAFAHLWFWMRQYAFDWPFLVDELARLFLALGLAATLLMAPLAATSNGAARARLGPAAWRRLHLLVFPAAALGWWHFSLAVRLDRRELYAHGLVLLVAFAYRLARAAATR